MSLQRLDEYTRRMAGQTLTQIRTLLAEAGLSPQHRLGQNFLIDLNLMRKALTAAKVAAGDVVLEVGAGTGSLTEMLLDAGCRVIAVEIDRGLLAILRSRFADHPRVQLIAGDALAGKHRLNPEMTAALRAAAADEDWKLVANLPYQIATPLLMELLLFDPPAACLTCTIQKEVGERLMAEPRTAAYGPASILAQTLARVKRVAVLPPKAFWPRPKV
ncbi:MAG: ribosomal RNA small subunit methyltransferase A, partial [Planctomycetota bacterium]